MAVEGEPEGVVPNKLWMGDLETYMDENFLRISFAHFGYNVQNIKWIRNHQTGLVARYCFVEFNDPIVARQALEKLNNQFIPGTNGSKKFKLNWASRRIESGQQEYNIFVADLSRDVTSQQLLEFFQKHFRSVRYAKVIEDEEGISKGYGFVRFMDEAERNRSYLELDGAVGLGRKAITIKPALAPKPKAPPTMPPQSSPMPATMMQQPPAYVYPPAYYTWPLPTYPTVQPYSYGGFPGYSGYESYGQAAVEPVATTQQAAVVAPPTEIHAYVEDLEDPNTPLDIEAQNAEIFRQDEDLFTELEGSRWNFTNS